MSTPLARSRYGSGLPIRGLQADARALSSQDFEERHGNAFLLLTAANLARPQGPASTEVQLIGFDDGPAVATASLSLVAFPVVRTGRSVGHLVTIGRATNNDVSIPDLSISRFHAFLKVGDNVSWQLQDAGSTNGTTVNGLSVPQQGHGTAVSLKSGDNVRLGQVELTFLSADELRDFALNLER